MVLVELQNLSLRYGTSIYAVDRVNGTMYGKFSIAYRLIPEEATVIPQYKHTSVEDKYVPSYENTLPGITSITSPIAKSTPVTQASHTPMAKTLLKGDIYARYICKSCILEKSDEGYGMCTVTPNYPFNGDSHTSLDVTRKINIFCRE